MASSLSEQRPMVGSCEQGTETPDSMTWLGTYWLTKCQEKAVSRSKLIFQVMASSSTCSILKNSVQLSILVCFSE